MKSFEYPCLISSKKLKADDYHKRPELSRSQVDDYRESPWLFWKKHIEKNPKWQVTATPQMQDGTLLHSLVLEHPHLIESGPCDFADLKIYPPDVLGKTGYRSTKACETFEEIHAGKIFRKRSEAAELWEVARMLASGVAGEALIELNPRKRSASNELTVMWEWIADDGTPIPLRARLDRLVKGDAIYDIKKCGVGDMEDLSGVIAKSHYDFQAAYYKWGLLEATGESLPFRFVFQQDSKPYKTRIYEMPDEWLMKSLSTIFATLQRLKKSMDSGQWRDSRSDQIIIAQLPKYHTP